MRAAVDLVPTDVWVSWLTPVIRALMDAGVITALGALVLIALLPNDAGVLTDMQRRVVIWLRRACTLLAVATLASSITTLSFFLGQSISHTLATPSTIAQFLRDTGTGHSILEQALFAWLAGMVTIYGRRVTHMLLAAIPLLLVIVIRAQTGHSGNSAWHEVATASWMLHMIAIGVWFGGLVAITFAMRADATTAPRLLARFSPIALICYIAVWLSGSANAAIRLNSLNDLVSTAYGITLLIKIVLTAAVGVVAWQLRTRYVFAAHHTAPGLATDTSDAGSAPQSPGARARVRWVITELSMMLVAGLVAVRLSSTAPPTNADAGADAFTTERAVLGFNPPPAPNPVRLLVTTWRPDGFWIVIVAGLLALYIAGYRRLRTRGDAWPPMRLISWMLGCALLTYCASGPLGVYGHILFSAHMAQHLLLVLVTPILLVGGAPTTLALRALPANRRDHGPREWLLAALSSKFLKVASHPIIAFVNFAAGFFILYFSGLFEWLMRSHLGHSFMQGHFLITGYMFIWCITGIDPSPRVLPAPAKVGLAVLAAPFHAIFSVIIMQSTSVIAVDYYAQFTHLYNTNLLHDQYLGASVGWAFGEVPLLVMIIIAVIQWVRSDAREAARFDRRDDERRAREAADGAANEASQTP